ncbi:hypothetical protein [Bradyrhizobium sp. Mp27]|uniref:hypothetical protein n=1 Tax=Bradyrhizobium sp. Mp27 TaxID=3042157 RepID=UPI00248AA7B7|nr:hypothetical protein [Bradyrhizobium sp. Mp27]MDI2076638.1 hypothetical protein [Bradyrhizobium sp. Mp27]
MPAAIGQFPETQRRKEAAGLQGMGGRRSFPSVLDIDALAASDEIVDDEAPNGSSIAFIAQWKEKRVLFGADAYPDLLAKSRTPSPPRKEGAIVSTSTRSLTTAAGKTTRAL